MNYKYIELARKIIVFPFRLVILPVKILFLLPIIVVSGFFITNFEEEWDRKYYFKTIKNCFKL